MCYKKHVEDLQDSFHDMEILALVLNDMQIFSINYIISIHTMIFLEKVFCRVTKMRRKDTHVD